MPPSTPSSGTRAVVLGTIGAIAFAGLTGCSPSGGENDEPSEIRIAVGAIPGTFDPWEGANRIFSPLMAVYEPLVGQEGAFQQGIAESWEVDPDGGSMELTLFDDITYHDGTHLTAETVYEFFDAYFYGPDAPAAPLVEDRGITIEVTGEYKIRINSEAEFRDFRPTGMPYSWLDGIPIISPAAVKDRSLLKDAPQGTGPYLLDDYQPEISISFVRNPDYRDPDAYEFDRVTFIAYSDPVAILNALKTDQVDTGVLNADLAAEAEAAGMNITTGLGSTTWLQVLDMDGSQSAPFGDVRVRRAIAMAFDREAIGDTLNQGFGYATSQLFTQGDPEYVEGGDDRYAYDPERAKELLAEAGYPDGFEFTMAVLAGWAEEYHPLIQQYLADIGITVTFDPILQDFAELVGTHWPAQPVALASIPIASGNGEYWIVQDFLGGTDSWETQPAQDLIWESLTGTNDERIAALTEFGEVALDEARYIPIGYLPTFYVSRPGFTTELDNKNARYILMDGFHTSDD